MSCPPTVSHAAALGGVRLLLIKVASHHRYQPSKRASPQDTMFPPEVEAQRTSRTRPATRPPPLSLGKAIYFLRGKLTILLALYASLVTVLYLRLASTGPSSLQQPILHGTSSKHDGSCWCSPDKYCLCTPSLAIDVVLESRDAAGELQGLVVVQRKDGRGTAVLGGFVEVGETVEDTVAREVKEETQGKVSSLRLLGTYSNPSRDPRRHTVSAVFVATVTGPLKAGDDAKAVVTLPLDQLDKVKWAFDHELIVQQYLNSRQVASAQQAGEVNRTLDLHPAKGISLCTPPPL